MNIDIDSINMPVDLPENKSAVVSWKHQTIKQCCQPCRVLNCWITEHLPLSSSLTESTNIFLYMQCFFFFFCLHIHINVVKNNTIQLCKMLMHYYKWRINTKVLIYYPMTIISDFLFIFIILTFFNLPNCSFNYWHVLLCRCSEQRCTLLVAVRIFSTL